MKRLLTLPSFSRHPLPARTPSTTTPTVVAKLPESKNAKVVEGIRRRRPRSRLRAVPGLKAAMIVVRTNDGCFARLAVQPAAEDGP